MAEGCIKNHLGILRNRYSEKRLGEAARRRAHLDYHRIRIGDGPGSGKVRFLLAQMHQNYYFGFFETACVLAGILLEQALVYRLASMLQQRGPIPLDARAREHWVASHEDLLDLELTDLVKLAECAGILASGRVVLLAHQIRWIRNMVVHDRIPVFRSTDGGRLEMKVPKSRRKPLRYAVIALDSAEVRDLTGRRGEITAYFCISRIREILASLLPEERTKEVKRHEDSSSLFRFEQSGQDARHRESPGARHGEAGQPG